MKRKSTILLLVVLLLLQAFQSVSAIEIKIANLAPENSPWGQALNRMASEWRRISNGRVTLRIYHGGIAGDEPDVIRKMRIGQLQGGVFTSSGLSQILPEILVPSMPMLIRNDEELDYVLQRVLPIYNTRLREAGFEAIAWTKAGWCRFFSQTPVFTPDEMKRQLLCTDPALESLSQIFVQLGYRARAVGTPEVLAALNSGMINAFYASPIGAASYQWFGRASNMLDLPFAPFLGAILLTNAAWRQVPQDIRPALMAVMSQIASELNATAMQLERDAITTMQNYGLTVNRPSAQQQAAWTLEFESSFPMLVGRVFNREMFDQIQGYLREVRR